MPEDNTAINTQVTQPQVTEGIKTQDITPPPEENKPYKVFNSQEEFNRHAVGAKKDGEKEATKQLMEKLGLKPDEVEKLEQFKQAYESSLSAEEKRVKDLKDFEDKVSLMTADIEEKDLFIAALCKISGKTLEDVEKVVKMAKGLKDEKTTIEEAIDIVFGMINQTQSTTTNTGEPTDINIPRGIELQQPDPPKPTDPNPFKKGEHYNLTEQGRLFRENPERARLLAKMAGIIL